MKLSRGFTLIEMIVAVGVFAVVMLIMTGAYLTLIDLNRKAHAVNTVMTDLSFALETMARGIRTGTNYSCGGGDCVGGGTALTFTDDAGRVITYRLAGTGLVRDVAGVTAPLTSPVVTIDRMKFYVLGTSPSDARQPRVTIALSGTIAVPNNSPVSFSFQTGATQRELDLGS